MVVKWSLCIGLGLEFGHECGFAGRNLSFTLFKGEFGVVPAFLSGRFGVFDLFVCWIGTNSSMSFLIDFFQLKGNKQKNMV